MANCSVTFFVEVQDVVVNWEPLTKGIILFFNHTIPLRRAPCKPIQVLSFSRKKPFCPSSCHSKIQISDHLLKPILNLYAFSANAARIKRQTSMKTKLFCSNRRNQLNVENVRSANQEREFLALDQSWASNFALFSSKIKKKYLFIDQSAFSNFAPFVIKRLKRTFCTILHWHCNFNFFKNWSW